MHKTTNLWTLVGAIGHRSVRRKKQKKKHPFHRVVCFQMHDEVSNSILCVKNYKKNSKPDYSKGHWFYHSFISSNNCCSLCVFCQVGLFGHTYCEYEYPLKGLDVTFVGQKTQIYTKITQFEDNDNRKLPWKYYVLRCCYMFRLMRRFF